MNFCEFKANQSHTVRLSLEKKIKNKKEKRKVCFLRFTYMYLSHQTPALLLLHPVHGVWGKKGLGCWAKQSKVVTWLHYGGNSRMSQG